MRLMEPMLTNRGDRITRTDGDGEVLAWTDRKGYTYDTDKIPADEIAEMFADRVPDYSDRATFLLGCDEAEARGVEVLQTKEFAWGIIGARSLGSWTDADQPKMVAALAEALR